MNSQPPSTLLSHNEAIAPWCWELKICPGAATDQPGLQGGARSTFFILFRFPVFLQGVLQRCLSEKLASVVGSSNKDRVPLPHF
jgi:hypothetical protein